MNDDGVFRALADASRPQFLGRLHGKNGQTLREGLDMTRPAVAQHLSISGRGQSRLMSPAGTTRALFALRGVDGACRGEAGRGGTDRRSQGFAGVGNIEERHGVGKHLLAVVPTFGLLAGVASAQSLPPAPLPPPATTAM